MVEEKILERYSIVADEVRSDVEIKKVLGELVPIYELKLPEIGRGTLVLMDKIRERLVAEVPVKTAELLDITAMKNLKEKFKEKGLEMIKKGLLKTDEATARHLIGLLVHEMLGLGILEMPLADPNLEDIVVNTSTEPAWVYHKKFGWLKTNIRIPTEADILNYASSVGRKVGRQITILNPLMDAHLVTGDRVNSTLFPISAKGNTISIRKFRRVPWTITEFLQNKTLNLEVAAWIWLAVQYELNMIISGGTGSGKTSLLNVAMAFIPPNHRVISIEDTRELMLANFLHWIPMVTRAPTPEGKGEVSMLDLLINSLRMRPDRIILGEIRRAREAEVLFEAMHTGHSVYATLHADTAEQTYRRLVNPPISVPEILMEAVHLFAVCIRDRRLGIRRIFELAELIPTAEAGKVGTKINVLYRWKPAKDMIEKENESYRLIEELRLHTGMTEREVQEDLEEKKAILKWFVKHNVNKVNAIGRAVAEYYVNPENILRAVRQDWKPEKIIPPEFLKD